MNRPFQGNILNNTVKNIFLANETNNYLVNKLEKKLDKNISVDREAIWICQFADRENYFKFRRPLVVHHKCYRANEDIWAQRDEEYVSLCNICHAIFHESCDIPFYDSNGVDYHILINCSRCNGQGYIARFAHIDVEICYKCNGAGYVH